MEPVAQPSYAYERDPLARELEVQILETGSDAQGSFVLLSDTILYPEGGGQPADHGRLDGLGEIIDVQRVEGQVRHYLKAPPPTNREDADREASGSQILVLHWARRFDHMQQHSAQHLLTAIAADRFGWQTTAFHLGERRSDIELDVARLDAVALAELEEAVADAIRRAIPIRAYRQGMDALSDPLLRSRGLPAALVGDLRIVEIEGLDRCTCGGTHLASTAEIEGLKLLDTESMRGGTRLYFLAGARLRSVLASQAATLAALRGILGVDADALPSAVAARLEAQSLAERELRRLQSELAEAIVGRMLAGAPSDVLSEDYPSRDMGFLQSLAQALSEAGRPGLLTAGQGVDRTFVLLLQGFEVGEDREDLAGAILDLLEAKGGGRAGLYRGKIGRPEAIPEARRMLSAAWQSARSGPGRHSEQKADALKG